jgi:hypothetical protein
MTSVLYHDASVPRLTVRSDESFSVSYSSLWTDLLHRQEIRLIIGHDSDRLCGLVVRVPAYIMVTSCASCEVRTELIYVM